MIIASLSWKGSPGTSPASATLFKALADHADEKGFCFPSIERLSRWCQHNVRTTRRAMDELKRSGWVKVVKRGRNHEYYLNLTMLCEGVLARGEKLTDKEVEFLQTYIGDRLSAVATDAIRPTEDNLSAIGSKEDTETPDTMSTMSKATPDKPGPDSGQIRTRHRTNQVRTPDISGRYIENRQEPSLEPSGGTVRETKAPPASQSDQAALASAMFEYLAITAPTKTLNLAAEAIRMQTAGLNLSLEQSMLLIRHQAELAPARGETVNAFWFEDSKWKSTPARAMAGMSKLPKMPDCPICKNRRMVVNEVGGTRMALQCECVTGHKAESAEKAPDGVDTELGARIWIGMDKALKSELGVQSYETWIKPIKPLGALNGELYLQIPSPDFALVGDRYEIAKFLPAGVDQIHLLSATGAA